MRPAVFLDRDGTLIEDRGHLGDPEEAVFFPDTVPALLEIQKLAVLFIVTHQPGIARGLVTADQVRAVNCHVTDYLARAGIKIRKVYCCPHDRSEGCRCVKPKPFHLHQAERDFGIDLKRSFVLGDHPHDVEFASSAGAKGVYLLSGHGRKHLPELPSGVMISEGIADACRLVKEYLTANPAEQSSELHREENTI